ncbi:MAG: UDP-N-acetylmuramoyl-L-alanyl-D-glutamate--2,6-diaminopimelate ligase [Candidatus Omnitrophica bacterium]|nr:UDP-N-acetylmuramoyl-L-alanyl-D-glutamate--2,6-diaminopimelate ligase [Candidatus Omnitrophota bacterium]
MILKNLLGGMNIDLTGDIAGIDIDLVTCDSRKCRPGSVFTAVKGYKTDGHQYIDQAIGQGASFVICENPEMLPDGAAGIAVKDSRMVYTELNRSLWLGDETKIKLIGITGTNGKTSTSFLIQHLLGGRNQCGLVGTIRCEGGSLSMESTHTTPDPEFLFPVLRRMQDDGCRYAVLEVSSHALDQGRLEGLSFDVALITNVTQDHLDYHGSMEAYLKAKMKICRMVGPEGYLIYNNDNKLIRSAIHSRKNKNDIAIGLQNKSQINITVQKTDLNGSVFLLKENNLESSWKVNMIGEHNVMNAAMAVTAASLAGVGGPVLSDRLSQFQGVDGRVEKVETGRDFNLYIDYAHTDDGLKNVLSAIKPLVKSRLLLLFGCGGDRDKGKRPLMAKVAQMYADYIVITSDNPRSESPTQIIRDIEAGFTPDFKNYTTQKDRRKAIRTALLQARSGDVVVIAGKGHESYQVTQGQKEHFSDKEECLKILQGQ